MLRTGALTTFGEPGTAMASARIEHMNRAFAAGFDLHGANSRNQRRRRDRDEISGGDGARRQDGNRQLTRRAQAQRHRAHRVGDEDDRRIASDRGNGAGERGDVGQHGLDRIRQRARGQGGDAVAQAGGPRGGAGVSVEQRVSSARAADWVSASRTMASALRPEIISWVSAVITAELGWLKNRPAEHVELPDRNRRGLIDPSDVAGGGKERRDRNGARLCRT